MRKPLLLAPLALAALAGCAPQHASVEIFALCAPPDDAAKCAFSATCDRVVGSAHLYVFTAVDVGTGPFTNELVQSIQINNQNPRNGDASAGRANTNDAVIEKYRLSYPGAGLPDLDYPATATIPAAGAQSPVVPLIPVEITSLLRAQLTAGAIQVVLVDLKAEGRYMDGTRFETGVFRVPVDVVNATFLGSACPTAGDLRSYCPNAGQTSSTSCAAP